MRTTTVICDICKDDVTKRGFTMTGCNLELQFGGSMPYKSFVVLSKKDVCPTCQETVATKIQAMVDALRIELIGPEEAPAPSASAQYNAEKAEADAKYEGFGFNR